MSNGPTRADTTRHDVIAKMNSNQPWKELADVSLTASFSLTALAPTQTVVLNNPILTNAGGADLFGIVKNKPTYLFIRALFVVVSANAFPQESNSDLQLIADSTTINPSIAGSVSNVNSTTINTGMNIVRGAYVGTIPALVTATDFIVVSKLSAISGVTPYRLNMGPLASNTYYDFSTRGTVQGLVFGDPSRDVGQNGQIGFFGTNTNAGAQTVPMTLYGEESGQILTGTTISYKDLGGFTQAIAPFFADVPVQWLRPETLMQFSNLNPSPPNYGSLVFSCPTLATAPAPLASYAVLAGTVTLLCSIVTRD